MQLDQGNPGIVFQCIAWAETCWLDLGVVDRNYQYALCTEFERQCITGTWTLVSLCIHSPTHSLIIFHFCGPILCSQTLSALKNWHMKP